MHLVRVATGLLPVWWSAAAALPQGPAAFRAQWSSERAEGVAAAAAGQQNAALPAHCQLAVVGAGWGGAYMAWRLAVDAGVVRAEDVCVFEANGRVGGRIYSVHGLPHFGEMALDVGGYRFISGDKLPGDLVQKALKLPTACYDWNCSASCEGDVCRILRDAYGNNAGYATAIEVMLGQVEDAGAGTQVYFGRAVKAILPAPEAGKRAMRIELEDFSSVTASQVVLNLPRNSLERLDARSVVFQDVSPRVATLLRNVTTGALQKVYVYYEDAWWNSKLGLMEGQISSKKGPAPLEGRYHDGPQKCFVGLDTAGQPVYSGNKVQFGNCSGALEIFYSSAVNYYRRAMTSPRQPLTVIDAASANHAQQVMLDEIHESLMTFHAAALHAKGIKPEQIAKPLVVAMANWIADGDFTPGIGAMFPQKDWAHTLVQTPTPDFDLYVANQDYGYKPAWAASSLIMAERILHEKFQLQKPSWLDKTWYEANILDKGARAQSNVAAALTAFV